MSMGVPDYWIKLIEDKKDEEWHVGDMFYELTNKRPEEHTISYAESHDQAMVGDKTIFFRLVDKDIYTSMSVFDHSLRVDRGMALHKMIRLMTIATAGDGYLNFMGNEFGHPEWIDFPREGNNWSYEHARRLWSLVDDKDLRFRFLNEFDKAIMRDRYWFSGEALICLFLILIPKVHSPTIGSRWKRENICRYWIPTISCSPVLTGSTTGWNILPFTGKDETG